MDNNRLLMKMIEFDAGSPQRIQHFLKVHAFAKLIGEMERIPEETRQILEIAAITHDIGIRISEKKYGDASGRHQEQVGPAAAEALLGALGYEEGVIRRVCYLIGHHHTYQEIDGMDYQILVEADFLVNLFEHGSGQEAVQTALDRIFVTETGKALCRTMFLSGISDEK